MFIDPSQPRVLLNQEQSRQLMLVLGWREPGFSRAQYDDFIVQGILDIVEALEECSRYGRLD